MQYWQAERLKLAKFSYVGRIKAQARHDHHDSADAKA